MVGTAVNTQFGREGEQSIHFQPLQQLLSLLTIFLPCSSFIAFLAPCKRWTATKWVEYMEEINSVSRKEMMLRLHLLQHI